MQIRSLEIKRYRGIEELTWLPHPGINCLIGPGDSGKSTILFAISLLLSPTNNSQLSEFDYYNRKISEGFEIEAFIGGEDLIECFKSERVPPLWGWLHEKPCPLPDENGAEPVLKCRVKGTADLELEYHLVNPCGEEVLFTSSLRRKMALSQLSGETTAHRNLRLGQGSLLDQFLEKPNLRPILLESMASASQDVELPEKVTQALGNLRTVFTDSGIEGTINLGVVPLQSNALSNMFCLVRGEDIKVAIPLAYSGVGTKKMAIISLAKALINCTPIIVIDEPETGLEPYRQRSLMKQISQKIGSKGQAFFTTHSTSVISALTPENLWRVSSGTSILNLNTPSQSLTRVILNSPEAFLSKYPVVCEGATEVGLFRVLSAQYSTEDFEALGLYFLDGGGQPASINITNDFIRAGIKCGAFLDKEKEHQGKRTALQQDPACIFGTWEEVADIEEAICKWLSIQQLELVVDAYINLNSNTNDKSGKRLGLIKRLKDRFKDTSPALNETDMHTLNELSGVCDDIKLRNALLKIMKDDNWFKSYEGGYTLGRALSQMHLPAQIESVIKNFVLKIEQTLCPQRIKQEPNPKSIAP